MANTRSPLLTGVTDKILTRERNIIPTSYAVGKTFTGAQLDDSVYLDTFIKPGIWRISNNITQNPDNKLPIDNIEGFLQVLEINHDEDTSDLNGATRIRQIVFPDHLEESSPYTRVGQAAIAGGDITWSEWGMMGGGNLRRVVLTRDMEETTGENSGKVVAKNNIMYEAFDNYTVVLPNPEKVPVGTRIGVEQYLSHGTVECPNGVTTLEEEDPETGELVKVEVPVVLTQVTEPDIQDVDTHEDSPASVGTWTQDPYGQTGESIVHNVRLIIEEAGEGFTVSAGENNADIVLDNIIFGSYTPVIDTEKVYKHTSAEIFLMYNTIRKTWVFVDNYQNDVNIVYMEGEYTVRISDAIAYVFECVIEDGTGKRQWMLDVTNNYANAVNILSGRIRETENDVNHINKFEIPTFGRKTIHHSHTSGIINISAKYSQLDFADEKALQDAVDDINDVCFYDHVVCVRYSSDKATITLPDPNIVPVGTSITYELENLTSGKATFTIKVTNSGVSQEFAVAAGNTVVAPFQCTAYSANSNIWTLLTVGGDTSYTSDTDIKQESVSNYIVQEAPVGTFRWLFGGAVPTGWLVCDGRAITSAQYPELYNFLGGTGDSVNLPNLINKFIKASTNARAEESAGLPNITGTADRVRAYGGTYVHGAFVVTKGINANGYNHHNNTDASGGVVGFDASRSNPIYGNSSTVTPANISAIPIIKAVPTPVITNNITKFIGTIFMIPRDNPPDGAFILNGQTLVNCDQKYPDFWNYVQNSKNVLKLTTTQYDNDIRTYGYTGGFVVDTTNKSVRLPDLDGAYILGAGTGYGGIPIRDGLPNIVATFPGTEGYINNHNGAARGAVKTFSSNTVNGSSANNVTDNNAFVFDASLGTVSSGSYTRSDTDGVDGKWNVTLMTQMNSPYGKAQKVTPPSIKFCWCIQVLPLQVVVEYTPEPMYITVPNKYTPDYANADVKSSYTVPATGWTADTDGVLVVSTNSPHVIWVGATSDATFRKVATSTSTENSINIPLAKGNVVRFSSIDDNTYVSTLCSMFTFIPYVVTDSDVANTEKGSNSDGIHYRKHTDGYLEVWGKCPVATANGNVVITFPAGVSFIDTDYNITTSITNGGNSSGSFVYVDDNNIKTNGMTLWRSAKSVVRWRACGYWK